MNHKEKRCVVFLSQRREEPHNTEIQEAQTTDEMRWEMAEKGSFEWARAEILGVDFRIRLIDQMPIPFIRNRQESVASIISAMKVAKAHGATDIGLGSLVASVTHGGIDILQAAEELDLRLDHGDDMSTALAAQAAWHLHSLGFPLEKATVGVVGAVGVMGAGFIRLLAQTVKKFVWIVTAVDERVRRLQDEVLRETAAHNQPLEIAIDTRFCALAEKQCQLVYVAHAAPNALFKPSHLSRGTIVLDACIPPSVSQQDFQGRDFLVLPVGCGVLPKKIALQGVEVNLGLGETSEGSTIYGCMIGCILAAHQGELAHRIGPVNPNYALTLLKEAEGFGIKHQPFGQPELEENVIRGLIKTFQ